MGAINKKPRPETWRVLEKIDFRDGRVNPRWAERHAVDVVEGGDAGEHQNGLQPRLEPASMSVRRLSPTITVCSE